MFQTATFLQEIISVSSTLVGLAIQIHSDETFLQEIISVLSTLVGLAIQEIISESKVPQGQSIPKHTD
jgi:hypothetical protein